MQCKQFRKKGVQTGKKRKKNILFFQKPFLMIVYYPYSYYFYLKKFVGFIFTLAATGREKFKGLPRTSRENLSQCSTRRESSNFFVLQINFLIFLRVEYRFGADFIISFILRGKG